MYPKIEKYASRVDEIADAAAGVFEEKGYNAATLGDVAARLGVTKGGIYHYIESKEQLLFLIFDKLIDFVLRESDQILAVERSPSEKLSAVVECLVRLVHEYRSQVTVFMRERHLISTPKYKEQIQHKRDRFEAFVRDIFREGMAIGEFRPLDDQLITFAFLGMCNWVYQWYRPDGRCSPAEIAAAFTRLFLDGIRLCPTAPFAA